MFYFLYKITNRVNGKVYVGVHKTRNMNDGYMGSGKVINRAIEKYGIDNFTKEILETFDSAEQMFAREKEIVTEDFLAREDTYNLRRGGHGGFDYINKHPDKFLTKKRLESLMSQAECVEKWKSKFNTDAVFREQARNRSRLAGQKCREKYPEGTFKNRQHSDKTKQVMSAVAKERLKDPTKNTQYGTMWINNGKINKKIKKQNQIPEGWKKGRIMNLGVN